MSLVLDKSRISEAHLRQEIKSVHCMDKTELIFFTLVHNMCDYLWLKQHWKHANISGIADQFLHSNEEFSISHTALS